MSDIFHFLANRAIEDAIEKGELKNLKGEGQPLPEWNGSAMDNILKAKGFVPKEVELRKKLAEMRQAGVREEECRLVEMEIRILTEQRMLQQAGRQP
jgi:hypothetical protein